MPTTVDAGDLDAARLVVKERRGAGSRSLGLGLGAKAALQHAAGLVEPVFQPFIAGEEHSVDVFVAAERRWADGVARRRHVVVGGESQVSTIVDAPDLVEECVRIAAALGLCGHAVFQAIRANGVWRHVECNPRFGGASLLAFAAGLRSPEYLLLETLAREPPRPRSFRAGLMLVRHPSDRIVYR